MPTSNTYIGDTDQNNTRPDTKNARSAFFRWLDAAPWIAAICLTLIALWPLSYASLEEIESYSSNAQFTAVRFATDLPGFDLLPPRAATGLALCVVLGLILFVGKKYLSSHATLSIILLFFLQPNVIVQSRLVAGHLPAIACLLALLLLTIETRRSDSIRRIQGSDTLQYVCMLGGICLLSAVNTIFCGMLMGVGLPIISASITHATHRKQLLWISLMGLIGIAITLLPPVMHITRYDVQHVKTLLELLLFGNQSPANAQAYPLDLIENVGYLNLPLFGLAPLAIVDALSAKGSARSQLLRSQALYCIFSAVIALLLSILYSMHFTFLALPSLVILEGHWISQQLRKRQRLTFAPIVILVISLVTLQDVVSSSGLPLFSHMRHTLHLPHRLIDFRDYWRLLVFSVCPLFILIAFGRRVDDRLRRTINLITTMMRRLGTRLLQSNRDLPVPTRKRERNDRRLWKSNTALVLLALLAFAQTTLMSFGALPKMDAAMSNHALLSTLDNCVTATDKNRHITLHPFKIRAARLATYIRARSAPDTSDYLRHTKKKIAVGSMVNLATIEDIISSAASRRRGQRDLILLPITKLALVHHRLHASGLRYDILSQGRDSLSTQFNENRWVILSPPDRIPATCRSLSPIEHAVNPADWDRQIDHAIAFQSRQLDETKQSVVFPIILPNERPSPKLSKEHADLEATPSATAAATTTWSRSSTTTRTSNAVRGSTPRTTNCSVGRCAGRAAPPLDTLESDPTSGSHMTASTANQTLVADGIFRLGDDGRPVFAIGHIPLPARDVGKLADFYTSIGCRSVARLPGVAILELRGGTHRDHGEAAQACAAEGPAESPAGRARPVARVAAPDRQEAPARSAAPGTRSFASARQEPLLDVEQLVLVQLGHLDHRLGAAVHAQLSQDLRHVLLDGGGTHVQLVRDLLVEQPLAQHEQHAQLLRGQAEHALDQRVGLALVRGIGRLPGFGHVHVPRQDGLQRGGQHLAAERLGQEPGRAVVQGLVDDLAGLHAGDDQHRQPGVQGAQPQQPIEPGDTRDVQVQQRDVVVAIGIECGDGRIDRGDLHGQRCRIRHPYRGRQRIAEQRMVIDDQDAGQLVHRVGDPGTGPTGRGHGRARRPCRRTGDAGHACHRGRIRRQTLHGPVPMPRRRPYREASASGTLNAQTEPPWFRYLTTLATSPPHSGTAPPQPATIATHCSPSCSQVIGEETMPVPVWNFHSSSPVSASNAFR